jgi:hypothetical protein
VLSPVSLRQASCHGFWAQEDSVVSPFVGQAASLSGQAGSLPYEFVADAGSVGHKTGKLTHYRRIDLL